MLHCRNWLTWGVVLTSIHTALTLVVIIIMIIILDQDHKRYGEFSTLPQYPMPPTERIYCSTLSQWPRMKVRKWGVNVNSQYQRRLYMHHHWNLISIQLYGYNYYMLTRVLAKEAKVGDPPYCPCLHSFDVIIEMQLGLWCGHAFDIATLLSLSSG